MEDLDKRGSAAAQQLVALLRSRQAIWVSFRTGIGSSLVLCLLAWGFSFIESQPLRRSLDIDGTVLVTLLFGGLSMAIHYHCLLQWAFRLWKEEGK